MGTREERVPNSAGGVRENITDKATWAENRQKPSAFLETKSGQPVHGSVCGGVGSHHTGGLASSIHGCYTARVGEKDREGGKDWKRTQHGGPCTSRQGAEISSTSAQ